jgi:hypothetical protein
VSNPPEDDIRKVLNSHGHAFQYAVLRRTEELADLRRSRWFFEAAEFPVTTGDAVLHIDFILRAAQRSVYLVAECKRVDPGRSRWCFARAPYTRRNATEAEVVFQGIRLPRGGRPEPYIHKKVATIPTTHLGIELRGTDKGDGVTGRGTLNEATTQVLRGMNGLVNHLFTSGTPNEGQTLFLPVIFTTASLWLAEGDLASADVATGMLPKDWAKAKEVEWLWYTYNQSPVIRHRLASPLPNDSFDLSAVMQAEFARTIAVVGPNGLDRFLTGQILDWL